MADVLIRSSNDPRDGSSGNPTPPNAMPRNQLQMQFLASSSSAASPGVANRADDGDDEKSGSGSQLSVLAVLVTIFRKSVVACRAEREKLASADIGWPTDVRHVAHVTFDRFNGFLGLPVELEPEVPRKPPSASTSVFGVSTNSMQLSYDSRGNSVPTILLLMQRRLYSLGGLQSEGIFRINAENTKEEFVRGHLNAGVVPDGVDVHCLAGLIKAWFRELPAGILDSLKPDQVMQCQSEEECAQLVKLLPQTEAHLLDWAVNLMADVVQMENLNKMNSRNIAMVFAPNMTQMADPLTALMYAVHMMNFLKSLVTRTLREREESTALSASGTHAGSQGENEHQSSPMHCEDTERLCVDEEATKEIFYDTERSEDTPKEEARRHVYSNEKLCLDHYTPYDSLFRFDVSLNEANGGGVASCRRCKDEPLNSSNSTTGNAAGLHEPTIGATEKCKGISSLTKIDSRAERTEAWRQER
uniref:Uncharacterized protein n=1 Tax=Kalanchoe fedtschenkoi TaxID=63787 RepID=A0A7N1A5Z0_KALFE